MWAWLEALEAWLQAWGPLLVIAGIVGAVFSGIAYVWVVGVVEPGASPLVYGYPFLLLGYLVAWWGWAKLFGLSGPHRGSEEKEDGRGGGL